LKAQVVHGILCQIDAAGAELKRICAFISHTCLFGSYMADSNLRPPRPKRLHHQLSAAAYRTSLFQNIIVAHKCNVAEACFAVCCFLISAYIVVKRHNTHQVNRVSKLYAPRKAIVLEVSSVVRKLRLPSGLRCACIHLSWCRSPSKRIL
jgi:hypothetical protein